MEIRVSPKMKATPGYIDLSFMELHAMQLSNHGNDPNFIVHRPFLWSIDVGQTVGDLDDDSIPIPKSPRRIISYSLSGDGSHLSTLSKMDKCLQLDLWKLSLDNNPTALVHIDVDTKQISSTQPKLSAQIQMPLLISGLKSLDPMMVSLSWDASNVAVIAEDDMHLARTTSIYVYHKDSSHPSEKKITSGQPNSFLPMPDEHLPEGLKGLCGYGKFHIATTNNQDARDELFITCDIFSVKIYGVFGSWQHLQTIALFKPDSIYSRKKLISGLNGRYFACSSSTNTILVYDLETGLVVSHMALGSSSRVRFSNDGSMMVVSHSGVITTRWTKSATAIASVDEIGSNAAFAHNDEKVIVSTFADKSYGRGEIGAIMDATSLSVEDILSIPMPYKEGRQKHMDNHGLTLYTAHGSKIDLIRVLDTVVQPYTRPRELCDETCYKELSPNMVIHSETPQGENEFTSASGLTFELRFHNARSQDWTDGPEPQSLSVLVSDKRGRSRMGLTIPAAAIAEPHWLQFKGFFQETSQRMIVYNCLFVMVWSLPTTLDSDFTLLSTWWAQPMPFEVSFEQQWYTTGTARCTHDVAFLQTLSLNEYYEEVPMDAFRLHHHNAFSSNPMAFLDGILVLVEMFRADDEIFQQAVLLYVGQHINSYPDPHNLASSVLVKICQAVSQKNHDHYAKFLKAFFESSYCRWVPRPDLNKETNPISILMKRSKTVPRAIDLVQIMISYCTRQAKKEKERDIHFTSPIMEPLHELIAQQDLHTDLAHSTLRKLAYIPVNERSHIVDHHIIAHPPEFRLRFWEHSTKPLYECGDPVLQLDLNPSTTSHDPQNDNFTRDLFVASFSMLWCAPEDKPDLRPSIAKIKSRARVPQSWIRTLFHVILLKCTLKSAVAVECHDFSLQMLDNPAIAALVEYKWNTIGYIHWLMRFLWQCIYYLLVLVAVFMQPAPLYFVPIQHSRPRHIRATAGSQCMPNRQHRQ
ncbi:hypothetical protein BC939DRAFT_217958 [Gamsiella multidivaricata]|uniref:uncharacterized protein n=1 Tax=Gamsiella multidivaricata TaxID=101098 RepID=UPI00222076D5|nr:uncharacterized protein BC939DRAFT_217958 [Gamsiella multidivaricata]KAI7820812.1 hypothetical protein BC939DRAFT_217958 [Gamsiella multidivaricata]